MKTITRIVYLASLCCALFLTAQGCDDTATSDAPEPAEHSDAMDHGDGHEMTTPETTGPTPLVNPGVGTGRPRPAHRHLVPLPRGH